MSYPKLILHAGKAHSLKRFHPWVFSGAVKKKEGALQEGDVVEVVSDKGEFLGIGHYGSGSIVARIFSFEPVDSLQDLWKKKFHAAYRCRKNAGLAESDHTTAYRLIHGEGDGMPGLIVDWYNGVAVVQCHTTGMFREVNHFTEVLRELYGASLLAVYNKSASTLQAHRSSGDVVADGWLVGSEEEVIISEHHHRFRVNWTTGQKTGFFLDQRDNRRLLATYAAGKKILNSFCYSGGFSVYALNAGATTVHSVDSSARAIQWTDENVALNPAAGKHQSFTNDIFDFLKEADNDYDIIILDPPAFAKSKTARHAAIKAYTRLNHAAFKKIKPGGIVFTFSCSQVVNQEMFAGAVTSAAIESGRNIRILHHLAQPADHPVSVFNPEAMYLKGLALCVD